VAWWALDLPRGCMRGVVAGAATICAGAQGAVKVVVLDCSSMRVGVWVARGRVGTRPTAWLHAGRGGRSRLDTIHINKTVVFNFILYQKEHPLQPPLQPLPFLQSPRVVGLGVEVLGGHYPPWVSWLTGLQSWP